MARGSNVMDAAPPRLGRDGGGGGWAWLLTATNVVEAELVRGVLASDGIIAMLDARDPSPGAWLFLSGNPNALVRVLVPRALLDDARLSLLEAGLGASDPVPAPEPKRRPSLWPFAITALVVLLYLAAIFRTAIAMFLRHLST